MSLYQRAEELQQAEGSYYSKTRYYFAYGSNLDIDQMKKRCADAKLIMPATLEDYELNFNGVATINRKQGSKVPGAIYHISFDDEVVLNSYEGFPGYYQKRVVTLHGRWVMFYFLPDGLQKISPPSKSYFQTIRKGYEDWGLNTRPLFKALQRSHNAEFEQVNDEVAHNVKS